MKPVLQALLLADRVYQDITTGKKIIAGTFNQFKIVKVKPAAEIKEGRQQLQIKGGMNAGSPTAYVNLTNVHGKISCILRYVSLADYSVIFETQFMLESDDPLRSIEFMAHMPPLPTTTGHFALELLCDDEPIGSARVHHTEVDLGDDHDGDH